MPYSLSLIWSLQQSYGMRTTSVAERSGHWSRVTQLQVATAGMGPQAVRLWNARLHLNPALLTQSVPPVLTNWTFWFCEKQKRLKAARQKGTLTADCNRWHRIDSHDSNSESSRKSMFSSESRWECKLPHGSRKHRVMVIFFDPLIEKPINKKRNSNFWLEL